MIFVTTGTQSAFPRLIDMVNSATSGFYEEVIYQNGDVWPEERYNIVFQKARVIIAHAGIGTLLNAIHYEKPLIVVPRMHIKGEKCNDHQVETAGFIRKHQLAFVAETTDELKSLLCVNIKPVRRKHNTTRLSEAVSKMLSNTKVLAVCSHGGHTMEMREILGNIPCHWVTTGANSDYSIQNTSRYSILKSINVALKLFRILRKEKPQVVISTGAAPGIIGIVIAKILGMQTIWVDSLACVSFISLSGRLACPFVDSFFTQWPGNVKGRIQYIGNVLDI